MRQVKQLIAALAVTAAATVAGVAQAPPASADTTTVLRGTWFEATAPTCTQTDASGRWTIALRSDGTATVSVTVFLDGDLHAAWGGSAVARTFTWTQSGSTYVITGGGLTFTVAGETIRFDIPGRYPTCDAHVMGTVTSS
ncbi:hypothetical protein [Nocardioides sp. HB32]